jgi:hypothetical protein
VSEPITHAVFHLFVIPQDDIVGVHPLEDQKRWSQSVLNWVCNMDEGEQSTLLLQLPFLWTDCCAIWHCHAEGGLHSSSCLARLLKFIVLTSLMYLLITLNWRWHLYPRIIRNKCIRLVFGLCYCYYGWLAASGPVNSLIFTAVKTMDPVSELIPMASSTNVLCRHLWIHWTGARYTRKFRHHTLPST